VTQKLEQTDASIAQEVDSKLIAMPAV